MRPDRDAATASSVAQSDLLWQSPEVSWRGAGLITLGIDVGSTTTQAVLLADGQVCAYTSISIGAESPTSASRALEALLHDTGITQDDIKLAVGTGCGEPDRSIVNRTVSEIACHARGARHAAGDSVRTVLAMGGRDCTAISCTDSGAVASFLANACRPAVCRENLCNACGAAQGQAIDAVAQVLSVPIDKVGDLSLAVDDDAVARRASLPHDDRELIEDDLLTEIGTEILAAGGISPLSGALSVVCAVLAGNQAAGLLRNGWSVSEILAAYSAALAHQAAQLIRRLGLRPELAITGGVAKNAGVVRRLERELGVRLIPAGPDPQMAAALGAALHAADYVLSSRGGE